MPPLLPEYGKAPLLALKTILVAFAGYGFCTLTLRL